MAEICSPADDLPRPPRRRKLRADAAEISRPVAGPRVEDCERVQLRFPRGLKDLLILRAVEAGSANWYSYAVEQLVASVARCKIGPAATRKHERFLRTHAPRVERSIDDLAESLLDDQSSESAA